MSQCWETRNIVSTDRGYNVSIIFKYIYSKINWFSFWSTNFINTFTFILGSHFLELIKNNWRVHVHTWNWWVKVDFNFLSLISPIIPSSYSVVQVRKLRADAYWVTIVDIPWIGMEKDGCPFLEGGKGCSQSWQETKLVNFRYPIHVENFHPASKIQKNLLKLCYL